MPRLVLMLGLRFAVFGARNRLASFISLMALAGIALGVSLLIVVLSVMNGFDKEVRERILALAPHATVHGEGFIQDWPSVAHALADDPEVRGTAPFIHLQGMLSIGDKVNAVLVYAVLPEYEREIAPIQSYLNGSLDDLGENRDGVILGYEVAAALQARIGEKINLILPEPSAGSGIMPRLAALEVVGILHTRTELDRHLALVHLSTAQRLLDLAPDTVQGIRIKVDNVFEAPRIVGEAMGLLPFGFHARDWTQSYGNLYQAVVMSKRLVSLLMFVIIGVAAFNVVSCLVIIVKDKEGDIAILRTMGMSPASIRGVFIVLGAYIGALGTMIGVLAGCVMALYVSSIVAGLEGFLGIQFLHSDVYPISYLPSDIRVFDVSVIVLVTLSLCLLATLYPAGRASRIAPAEVLRHDG